MIAPNGFILLQYCEEYWIEKYFELNFQKTLDVHIDVYEQVKDSALIEYVEKEVQTQAAYSFISAIKTCDLTLFYENSTYSVSKDILTMYSDDSIGETLGISGDREIYYHPQDHIDFLCLPRWNDKILFYLEPSTWTVNTKGYNFISKNIPKTYNPFIERMNKYYTEIGFIEGIVARTESGDFDEALVDLEEPTQESYYNFINDEADFGEPDIDNPETKLLWPIPSRSYDIHDYADFLEVPIQNWQIRSSSPFSKLFGASLCLKIEEWLNIKNNLELSSEMINEKVKRSISDEKTAVESILQFLSENNLDGITKAKIKQKFGSKLGERAFIRVWTKITEKHPQLQTPGRRPK